MKTRLLLRSPHTAGRIMLISVSLVISVTFVRVTLRPGEERLVVKSVRNWVTVLTVLGLGRCRFVVVVGGRVVVGLQLWVGVSAEAGVPEE